MTATVLEDRTINPRLAAAVDAAPSTSSQAIAFPAEFLDGGEVVLLALKPSLWYVLFDSFRWLIAGMLVIAMAATTSLPQISSETLIQVGLMLMGGRICAGFLRWVSRFYVLTNRRVMCVRGVFRADIASCPLLAIRNTRVTVGLHERFPRLGTLRFYGQDGEREDLPWLHISSPEDVHSRVRRAIERAIDNQPHV